MLTFFEKCISVYNHNNTNQRWADQNEYKHLYVSLTKHVLDQKRTVFTLANCYM